MSDPTAGHGPGDIDPADVSAEDEHAAPRRVIGTPSPAEFRSLLGGEETSQPPVPQRELPAVPPDLASA